MNEYEVTLILEGKATAAKKKKIIESTGKLVKSLKGKIVKTDDWGVKELMYKINKNSTGVFLNFLLELDGAGARELKDKLRVEPGVVRSLLVRKGKK